MPDSTANDTAGNRPAGGRVARSGPTKGPPEPMARTAPPAPSTRGSDGSHRPPGYRMVPLVPEVEWCPGLTGPAGLMCWDLNANGLADPAEDINGDTVVNTLDCAGPQGVTGADRCRRSLNQWNHMALRPDGQHGAPVPNGR